MLAALSRVLTTLLARLLLSALLAAALALLARLLFIRVHNGSFVGPPLTTKPSPPRFPRVVSAAAPKLKLADGADQRARAALGQRERNKLDKLGRIKDAARGLFLAKGFDDTTTREIATRAGAGIGTIFVYAENKRDLLGA